MAYSVEGGHSKLCPNIKKMCLQNPAFAHSILEKYTDALCVYASYQVNQGHLSETLYYHRGDFRHSVHLQSCSRCNNQCSFNSITTLISHNFLQIESGAQILQIFESWAHHLSEEQFVQFAKVSTYAIINTLTCAFICLFIHSSVLLVLDLYSQC